MTDNKNRTLPEIRTIFSKNGGNLGESGSVRFLFQKKGYIAIEKDKATEDAVMEAAIEAGAEDVRLTDQHHEVVTEPEAFNAVKAHLEEKKIPLAVSELSMIPDDRSGARRPQGRADDEADGSARGPRRRSARLGQLRLHGGAGVALRP